MTSLVTIIIPCYNIAPYLQKCVDSILKQTYPYFELLLLDDGSADATLELCKVYEKEDNRVRVFKHQNKGVSYTRNRGIKEAKGEYIMFVDGDDYVESDYIEKHLEKTDIITWTISGMINVKNNLKSENIYFKKLLSLYPEKNISVDEVLNVLKYYSLSSPCCRLYSINIIRKNNLRFDENVSYQEDLLFNLLYINHIQNIQLLNFFGYYYVQHDDSSSSKYHQNFGYNDELFQKLTLLIKKADDKVIVDEFVMNTMMKRLSNIFHINSPFSKEKKMDEIKNIFNNQYFESARNYLKKSDLNPLLRNILYFKAVYLVYIYFQKRIF